MGRTHALSGAALWLAIAPATPFPLQHVALGTVVAAAGALLPDFDEPGAKASRVLGPLRYPICMTIRRVAGGHRGATHHLWLALLVGALLWLWTPWVGAAVAIGMAAHSLGDMCTKEGVTWLAPLPIRFRGPLITGGPVETWAVAPALTLACLWLAWQQVEAPAGEMLTAVSGWRP